jgi:Tfp pilus assembly protein PilE
MSRWRRIATEQGETLIELVIAIAILGVCVVAIGSGVAASVVVSGTHRDLADASQILHNDAEALEADPYVPCATATSYAVPSQAGTGWRNPTVTVKYWNGSSFPQGGSCSSDQGLQQVTLTLTNKSGRVTQSLTLVLRSPT